MEASIKKYEQPPPDSQPLKFDTLYSQNTWSQFVKCFWKQNLLYWRDPPYNAYRIIYTVIAAVVLGSIFWDIGGKRYASFMIILICYKKNILPIKTKAKVVIMMITMSLIFYRETTTQVLVIMGAQFSALLFLGVKNGSSVQPVVSVERTVFYREKAAGMYSPIAYAAAQV